MNYSDNLFINIFEPDYQNIAFGNLFEKHSRNDLTIDLENYLDSLYNSYFKENTNSNPDMILV